MPPGVADPAFRSPKNGRNKPTSMDKEPVKSSSLLSISWHLVVLKEWTVPTCSQGRSRTPSPNFGDNLVGNSFQGRRLPSSFTQRQGSRSVSACFNFCVRNAVCSGIKHTCCKIATTLSECYNFCIGKPAQAIWPVRGTDEGVVLPNIFQLAIGVYTSKTKSHADPGTFPSSSMCFHVFSSTKRCWQLYMQYIVRTNSVG